MKASSGFLSLTILVLVIVIASCGGGNRGMPAPVTVSVTQSSSTVQAGGTVHFTAIVTNDSANKGIIPEGPDQVGPAGHPEVGRHRGEVAVMVTDKLLAGGVVKSRLFCQQTEAPRIPRER